MFAALDASLPKHLDGPVEGEYQESGNGDSAGHGDDFRPNGRTRNNQNREDRMQEINGVRQLSEEIVERVATADKDNSGQANASRQQINRPRKRNEQIENAQQSDRGTSRKAVC